VQERKHEIIEERSNYPVIKGEKIPLRLRVRARIEGKTEPRRAYSTRYHHPSGILAFVSEMSSNNRVRTTYLSLLRLNRDTFV